MLSTWDTVDMIFQQVGSATLPGQEHECQLCHQTAFAHLGNQNCSHQLGTEQRDASQKKVLALER